MIRDSALTGRAAAGDRDVLYWAGLGVMLGALGVVVTSGLYAVSPPRAALPMPNPALDGALRDMLVGRSSIVAAGTVGVISDVILAASALVLAAFQPPAGRRFEPLGWACIAISNLVFIMVDGLSAGVLPRLAALEAGAGAFAALKLAYDLFFIVGTLAFGLGGSLVLWSELASARPLLPKPLAWLGLALSAVGLLSALLYFANVNLAPLIGISIGGGAAIFAVYGALAARLAAAPVAGR